MTRNERALWALDVMGGIDAALVEEAETRPKRGRKPALFALLAAALAVLAVGGAMVLRRDEASPPIETTIVPTTTAHVHAEGNGIAAFQSAHIRWQGVSYELAHYGTKITPGEQLDVIEFCNYLSCMQTLPKDDPRWTDLSLTASNVIEVGAPIYTCEGYPAAWRICAYGADGKLRIFERNRVTDAGESLAGRMVGEFFPDLSTVEQIDLHGNSFLQAEIDHPAVIAALLAPFTEAVFIPQEEAKAVYESADYASCRLCIHFADGTTTDIRLASNGIGHWLEYVRIPDGLYEAAAAQAIFPGGEPSDYDFDYGGSRAWSAYLSLEGYKHSTDYTLEPVWVEGTTLFMGMRKEDDRYIVLADDAAGDIRVEGIDIYYRTTTGAIARIRYWYPRSQGDFYSELRKGVDMTDYITAHEIVDPGPYVRFQLRLGVRWTLDAKGRLARNGEIIAEGVRDFKLAATDVVYAADSGAYRRAEDGTTVRLTDVPVNTIITSGLYICYATETGELHRVRCDGAKDSLLGHIDCAKLAFCRCNGSDADCLAILTDDGRACLLMDGTLYTLAEYVADVDANGGIYLTLTMADGSVKTGQLDYFAAPNAEHGDPAGLQFEGVPVTKSALLR